MVTVVTVRAKHGPRQPRPLLKLLLGGSARQIEERRLRRLQSQLPGVVKWKIHAIWRISLVVALVAHLAGCATYLPARLPCDTTTRGDKSPRAPVVVGVSAKATLDSGDVVTGEVTAVTDSSLTIGRAGNYGFQERVVFVTELVRLEVEDQSGFASSSVGVVAGVVILLTLGIVVLAATHDQVGEL